MNEMHGAVGDELNLPATIKTEIVILADDEVSFSSTRN